jgi:hypothetical protein
MKRKEFTPGQLVWLGAQVESWSNGLVPCKSGYPERVLLARGAPATIIRRALAKDFGIYGRHTHKGVSTAARLAGESWLVLYDGIPVMIKDAYLCKRRHTPRKQPKEV